jgi:HPt (histidine-containing phosphotransfer) domain-containing protein
VDGLGLLPAAAEAFRKDVPHRLAALDRAINDKDGSALTRAAHALRGAAANIGATTAAALCGDLETLGSAGQYDDAAELVRRLETELEQVDIELDRALDVAP